MQQNKKPKPKNTQKSYYSVERDYIYNEREKRRRGTGLLGPALDVQFG